MTHISVMNRRQRSRRRGPPNRVAAGCWGFANNTVSYNYNVETKAHRQARGPRGRTTTCFTCVLHATYCDTTFIINTIGYNNLNNL